MDNIRERINQSPKKSLTRLSQQAEVPRSTCHRILKNKLKMHPYKITVVQELLPRDFEARMNYCYWFQNTFDDRLLDFTFYSDEAWFHLSGYINSQNFRTWSSENPHET